MLYCHLSSPGSSEDVTVRSDYLSQQLWTTGNKEKGSSHLWWLNAGRGTMRACSSITPQTLYNGNPSPLWIPSPGEVTLAKTPLALLLVESASFSPLC